VTPNLCAGDCDHSGQVTVADIVTMVNVALARAPFSDCSAGDANGDTRITVNDILAAVNNVLSGC
jgi:hypothetical protein